VGNAGVTGKLLRQISKARDGRGERWNRGFTCELLYHYSLGFLPAVWRCAHPGCTQEIAALTVST
jgi:hypothetical protein